MEETDRPMTPPEVSIVIPCLNEAETLGVCLDKVRRSVESNGIDAEVIVADNGSQDGSIEIAEKLGARVVHVQEKGYGSALQGGINAARASFVIMADADDSYDFLDTYRFVDKLRQGHDLVQGCRLPSGGGQVLHGAMPWSHRWIGNPLFSFLARLWFGAPINDIYCGFRGFRKDFIEQLGLKCTGMEFATEMIIKASLFKADIAEIPITLHPDGRISNRPHLRTIRDGWRTLRLFLLFSPLWLFFIPGILMILLGTLGYTFALPQATIAGVTLDAHTLIFSSLFMLCGYQSILFAMFAKVFGLREGFYGPWPSYSKVFKYIKLEHGIGLGLLGLCFGLILLVGAIFAWRAVDYGPLDYSSTMRIVIPGATATALGFQTILASFLLSILGLERKTAAGGNSE